MKKTVRLTESDLNRIVRKVINEGVEIEEVSADYADISKQMRPGTQTSATLYFDKGNNIRMRVGNQDFYLFSSPQPAAPQPGQK
jgi:hypothetical protein